MTTLSAAVAATRATGTARVRLTRFSDAVPDAPMFVVDGVGHADFATGGMHLTTTNNLHELRDFSVAKIGLAWIWDVPIGLGQTDAMRYESIDWPGGSVVGEPGAWFRPRTPTREPHSLAILDALATCADPAPGPFRATTAAGLVHGESQTDAGRLTRLTWTPTTRARRHRRRARRPPIARGPRWKSGTMACR